MTSRAVSVAGTSLMQLEMFRCYYTTGESTLPFGARINISIPVRERSEAFSSTKSGMENNQS